MYDDIDMMRKVIRMPDNKPKVEDINKKAEYSSTAKNLDNIEGSGTYIVIHNKGGSLAGSAYPYQHINYKSAKTEAERLAGLKDTNVTSSFIVFKAISTSKKVDSPVKTFMLNELSVNKG